MISDSHSRTSPPFCILRHRLQDEQQRRRDIWPGITLPLFCVAPVCVTGAYPRPRWETCAKSADCSKTAPVYFVCLPPPCPHQLLVLSKESDAPLE